MPKEYEVSNGRVFCPQCRMMGLYSVIAYITPDTRGQSIVCLCRRCKRRHVVDIADRIVRAH